MNSKKHPIKNQNDLLYAYEQGDFKKFCQLIEDGSDINCILADGESLISNVVENLCEIKNNKKFFDKLMSLNVSFQHGKNECDLLSTAIRFQPDIYYMKKLLEKGIKINSLSQIKDDEIIDHEGIIVYGPSIYEAISSFDTKKIDLLLKYKPDLEICNSDDVPLLSFLMYKDSYNNNGKLANKYFPILMKKGASIFETDLYGKQPIHYWAAYNGNINNFDLLIKRKININAKDKYGNTPLMEAASSNNYKSASILIKNNADLNIQNKDGKTALMMMTGYSCDMWAGHRQFIDIRITKTFLKSGCDFLLCDDNLENIAHYLAHCPTTIWSNQDIEIYSKLFNKHPKLISQKNKNGKTPMDILKNKNKKIHSKFMKLIEKNTSHEYN